MLSLCCGVLCCVMEYHQFVLFFGVLYCVMEYHQFKVLKDFRTISFVVNQSSCLKVYTCKTFCHYYSSSIDQGKKKV